MLRRRQPGGLVDQTQDTGCAHLGVLAQKLEVNGDAVRAALAEPIGIEADGPVMAADGEGAGPDELAYADSLVLAVPEDPEHVAALRLHRDARRYRPCGRHQVSCSAGRWGRRSNLQDDRTGGDTDSKKRGRGDLKPGELFLFWTAPKDLSVSTMPSPKATLAFSVEKIAWPMLFSFDKSFLAPLKKTKLSSS